MIDRNRDSMVYNPTSTEMEENLCYLLLATERAWPEICGTLAPEDVSDTACRAILSTAYTIAESGGTPWDLVEYIRRLGNHVDFPPPNGFAVWLGRVQRKYCMFTHLAKQYAESLAELAAKRRELAAAERAVHEARETGGNVAELLASELGALKSNPTKAKYRTVMDTIESIVTESINPDERKQPVPTGLAAVDRVLNGGARPGQYVTLAACTGIGKSAFALQWCDELAKLGRKSVYFSLEMPASELHIRLLAARTGISTEILSTGRGLTDEHRTQLIAATADTDKITVIDDVRRSIWELRNPVLDINPDLIVIDYLQLLPTDPRLENRQLQVSANCRALKELAMSIRKPLVVLAQLSRQAEGVTPLMSHLRESGDIENTSDLVIFLHRARDPRTSEASLIVAKNRNGKIGQVNMVWRGDKYRYDVAETRTNFDEGEADIL